MIQRVASIYRDNKSTFYDYRTGRPHNIYPRLVAFVLVSMFVAWLMQSNAKDLLDIVITAQAILIGFSFSVMFFLVQPKKGGEVIEGSSLERRLREEQLDKLSKELFWNISYFNLCAISGLIFAVALMIPNMWTTISNELIGVIPKSVEVLFKATGNTTNFLAKCLFCFLLIESSFTFFRTVGRVNFLFEERMS